MKIYVVEYHCHEVTKVSSEGYKTLEDAQAFIRSRNNVWNELDAWNFIDTTDYKVMACIREITIKD